MAVHILPTNSFFTVPVFHCVCVCVFVCLNLECVSSPNKECGCEQCILCVCVWVWLLSWPPSQGALCFILRHVNVLWAGRVNADLLPASLRRRMRMRRGEEDEDEERGGGG